MVKYVGFLLKKACFTLQLELFSVQSLWNPPSNGSHIYMWSTPYEIIFV